MADDSKQAEKAYVSRAGVAFEGALGMELIRVVGGATDSRPFVVATK